MTTQPEAILEDNLVEQLTGLGYAFVSVNNEEGILSNLKNQLEKFNSTAFSEREFNSILNHLARGNVFENIN